MLVVPKYTKKEVKNLITECSQFFYDQDKEERLRKSDKFHSKSKGCNIRSYIIRDGKNIFRGKYCETHKKELSYTGWEIGFYRGTNSKALSSKGKQRCSRCNRTDVEFHNKYLCEDCFKKRVKELGLKMHYCKCGKELGYVPRSKMCRECYLKKVKTIGLKRYVESSIENKV